MSYRLVIVESPAKCKKIEQYLNTHKCKRGAPLPYKCMASCGHIRELAGLESIDQNNNFAPTFIECASKKEHISKLKKAVKDASEVILASDDDREGESIAWHICQVLNLPVECTKRIIFHEITEKALHQAIENPVVINMSTVNAQMARQVLDMLVGYKISPLLWKHVKDGLSAGRCQTPALRLIYDNEKEIQATTGKQSYTITGYFTNAMIPFVLNHEEDSSLRVEEFLQASLLYSHQYKGGKLQTKTRAIPAPFSTSSLQQHCSNELQLSPKETMGVCQSLYENGYITYHRTDSKVYSQEFKAKAAVYIAKTYGDTYAQFCDQEQEAHDTAHDTASDTAHEAIRITQLECLAIEDAVTNKKENRVYQLIRQRTLESCMTEAKVSVLTAVITAPYNHEYHYTAEQIIFPGWKIVGKNKKPTIGSHDTISESNTINESNSINESNTKHYAYLQTIKTDLLLPYQKIKAIMQLKALKSHYTEARLVQLLEEKGIGRPSTFASLVEKIQERKYVKKENIKGKLINCTDYEIGDDHQLIKITTAKEFGNEKQKLVITPTGTIALEFLLKHFNQLFHYAYTEEMETALDAVACGKKIWYEVCKACSTDLENLSATIEEKGKETIRIDANHAYMIGKYGPVIKCTGKGEGTAAAAITFKAARTDIDLNKLRKGEYTLNDIVAPLVEEPSSIGNYLSKPVYIKVGKFGTYLEWNSMTKSLKMLKQKAADITIEDVSELLFDMDNGGTSASLRKINEDATICKGNYGDYILYKKAKMKKPRFLKLNGFQGDYLTCELPVLQEWFKTTYLS